MKILLFTDSHYCSRENACKTRRPILSYAKIDDMLNACPDADLILCLGDFIDDGGDPAANITHTETLMARIRADGRPFLTLMGNHDCHAFTREAFGALTGNAVPPLVLHEGATVLIFLNAGFSDDGTPYAPGKINWKNSWLPPEQLDAMRNALTDPGVRDAYVFVHQNLDPGVQVDHIIRNADAARAIIAESGKVRTVYQGHYHHGHEAVIDGIPYITLRAMCEGEENSYRIVEI